MKRLVRISPTVLVIVEDGYIIEAVLTELVPALRVLQPDGQIFTPLPRFRTVDTWVADQGEPERAI